MKFQFPLCQSVIKIVNMPPPFSLRNSTSNDKKMSRTNQLKPVNPLANKKVIESEQMISDLMIEIHTIMGENAKLRCTNAGLKSTLTELEAKYKVLLESVEENKMMFEKDLNKLQGDIIKNETHLIQNNKKCVLQQKKHIQEIKKLKSENEKLKSEMSKKEIEYAEKVETLESELKLIQLSFNNMKSLNEENSQRSAKYRHKLKYAITIINDMNNMMAQYSKKPSLSHRETQTGDTQSQPVQNLHTAPSCTVPQSQPNLETENLLLSDVFFKSKAFCDNEILLFNEQESMHNFDYGQRIKLDV